ncbi:MAG: type II secretion system protein [Acidimicrobiales bacterium]
MFKAAIKRLRQKNQEEDGFTLVELMVVVVILGILAAVAVFAVAGLTDRGEEAACESTARAVQTAAEAYFAQASQYAETIRNDDTRTELVPDFLRLDDDIVMDDENSIRFDEVRTVTYNPGDGQVNDTCEA